MKKILFPTIWFLFTLLIGANIVVFVSQMQLSERLTKYESGLRNVKQENLLLEQKAVETNSLEYASSMAAEMNFTKKAELNFLENLQFALKK
ncbi:MAG: hypothetical protein AAB966_05300 [Patescibacteria group bacterium]